MPFLFDLKKNYSDDNKTEIDQYHTNQEDEK